jgi:hypothetical protein
MGEGAAAAAAEFAIAFLCSLSDVHANTLQIHIAFCVCLFIVY